MAPGSTAQLDASVLDAAGGVMPGAAVSWESDDSNVALVSVTGLVEAVAAGQTNVRAISGSLSAVATVTVVAIQVASVEVDPSTATLDEGATTTLSVTVRASDSSELQGRPVSWSTSDDGVAVVAASTGYEAIVEAVGAGDATITATVEGIEAFAQLTVESSPPPPPGGAAECDSPASGWIWCDDFEEDRLGAYFEVHTGGGALTRAASIGYDGSTGMQARWTPGLVNAGALHLAIGRSPDSYRATVTSGTEDYREIYWRVYVRYQDGWVGDGASKMSRAFIYHSPDNWGQAMIAHLWAGGPNEYHLKADPVSGTDAAGNLQTTTYNDFANFRWLGGVNSTTPVFDPDHVGEWYCVEAQVRLNDAGSTNGVFRLWIDDDVEAEREDLDWVGAYDDYGINAVFLENYWNAGSPATQDRYMDNFVVSTERIGCLP